MKDPGKICTGLIFALMAQNAMAADDDAAISQVSNQAIPMKNVGAEESSLMKDAHNDGGKKDYQKQIMSNPEITGIGRAGALTGGGGNTAIITQQGSSNRSTIKQTGKNNYASQTQNGKSNDISLEQQGNNNRSEEKQIGDYNHKVKVQNGNREETTTGSQE